MDNHEACRHCGCSLVPQRLWRAADKGDRKQWLREGLRMHAGHGLCARDYKADMTGKKPVPKTPPPCTVCGEPARGVRAKYCDPCRKVRQKEHKARFNEKQARERVAVALPPPDYSPNALTGGRWVFCPRRRIQVWQDA